jgi:hypothetical protein
LPDDEINMIVEYYHINYSKSIENKNTERHVSRIIDSLKINRINSRRIVDDELFSDEKRSLLMLDYKDSNSQERLEILSLLWEKTDDVKLKKEYEEKMLSESKIIINSLQKITKIKVLLEKLND